MIRALPVLRTVPSPRVVLAAVAAVLAGAALLGVAVPAQPAHVVAPAPGLSDRLSPKTWALAIPVSWLSAPIPGLRDDDVLNLLGARSSERATASEVASGLRVMAFDDRALVVELTAEDASAIAGARSRGLSLVPILRSRR